MHEAISSLPPQGLLWAALEAVSSAYKTFAASASGRYKHSNQRANSPLGSGALRVIRFAPRYCSLEFSVTSNRSLPATSCSASSLQAGNLCWEEDREGAEDEGLDGCSGSDPDVSSGGGLMLCLFLTLCLDRVRGMCMDRKSMEGSQCWRWTWL